MLRRAGTAKGRRRRLRRVAGLLLAAAIAFMAYSLPWWGDGWPLRADERVLLFTTSARLADDGQSWIVPIHGWVFEPEQDDPLGRAGIAAARKAIDLDEAAVEGAIFTERIGWFLVDNQRGKKVVLRIAGVEHAFGPTDSGGHFRGSMLVPAERVAAAAQDGVLPAEILSPAHPAGTFTGRILLVEPRGLSVLSDVDDTIKVSEVLDKKVLLRNTFERAFVAAAGMPQLYGRFRAAGASFHYVSSSPWQLYDPLRSFLHAAGYPEATLSLKRFRLKDSSLLDLLANPLETKPPAIEALLGAYPGRRFCLVGDSGEKDPEIYGLIARRHPDQIACVYIRNVSGEQPDSPRMREALRDVDPGRWQLFTDPGALPVPAG
jgi:phosphatidate phosphatase APP1